MLPTGREKGTIKEKKLQPMGHVKKNCLKYAKWLAKRDKLLNFVCSEVNLALAPNRTWWIDTGATTHIRMTMQGCSRSRLPIDIERFIYVGDGNKAPIEVVG